MPKRPVNSQESAFHQQIADDPHNQTTLNAYADWLEDNGKPTHAEVIRRHIERVVKQNAELREIHARYTPEERQDILGDDYVETDDNHETGPFVGSGKAFKGNPGQTFVDIQRHNKAIKAKLTTDDADDSHDVSVYHKTLTSPDRVLSFYLETNKNDALRLANGLVKEGAVPKGNPAAKYIAANNKPERLARLARYRRKAGL